VIEPNRDGVLRLRAPPPSHFSKRNLRINFTVGTQETRMPELKTLASGT
jgi:hypothetical protein